MTIKAPLAARRKILGCVAETVNGTAAAVAAALANTTIYDAKMVPDGLFDGGERAPNMLSYGSIESVPTMQKGKLTFKQELRYNDAFLLLLQGAGYGATGTPSSDPSNHVCLSFALWESGRRKGLIGAACTSLSIEGSAGQRVFANWEFSGVWQAPIAEAMPAQATINAASFRAGSMTLTDGGAAPPFVSSFTVALNPATAPRPSIAAGNGGLLHYFVGDRKPTIKLDPEARLIADYDALGILLAGTAQTLILGLTSTAGGLAITATKAQRKTADDAERDNKLTDPVELDCHQSSAGDDDLIFAAVAP